VEKCRTAAEATSLLSNQRRRCPGPIDGHCEKLLVGVRHLGELGRETVKKPGCRPNLPNSTDNSIKQKYRTNLRAKINNKHQEIKNDTPFEGMSNSMYRYNIVNV